MYIHAQGSAVVPHWEKNRAQHHVKHDIITFFRETIKKTTWYWALFSCLVLLFECGSNALQYIQNIFTTPVPLPKSAVQFYRRTAEGSRPWKILPCSVIRGRGIFRFNVLLITTENTNSQLTLLNRTKALKAKYEPKLVLKPLEHPINPPSLGNKPLRMAKV